MSQKTVLSLIQPTGDMHLGNYFGAIQNWVKLQSNYQCILGIADYHTMTMPYQPVDLRRNTWLMVYRLIACGVVPENLLIQSLVPEHTELCWILSCVCSIGELSRMTQFKDKSNQSKETTSDTLVSAGLLFYPVLQAADILIYHANYVPIGKDQDQHLELSRNIAARFNNTFNIEYFKHPEPLYTDFPKILSLADPDKKMSKSLGEKHYINVFGEQDKIIKQVKSAVTDSGPNSGMMSPGVNNLIQILAALGENELSDQFKKSWQEGSIRYGDLKSVVAEKITLLTESLKLNFDKVISNESEYKQAVLESSEEKRKIAANTLKEVREIVGLTKLSKK